MTDSALTVHARQLQANLVTVCNRADGSDEWAFLVLFLDLLDVIRTELEWLRCNPAIWTGQPMQTQAHYRAMLLGLEAMIMGWLAEGVLKHDGSRLIQVAATFSEFYALLHRVAGSGERPTLPAFLN